MKSLNNSITGFKLVSKLMFDILNICCNRDILLYSLQKLNLKRRFLHLLCINTAVNITKAVTKVSIRLCSNTNRITALTIH